MIQLSSLSKIFAVLSLSIFFSACSRGKGATASNDERNYLASGQIVISRPAPEASAPRSLNMMGFVPVLGTHVGNWLSVNRADKNLSLMEGNRVISSSKIKGADSLTPGSFQVLHMQRNPLWYAPDSYFTNRHLVVPPQGDKDRFRRGALGEFAIFLNKETPIHSGPVWSEEIGGVKVEEADLSKIYYQLQVGSIIEVK